MKKPSCAGRPLLVSIIINNYNYGRFLDAAIGGALYQTHPAVEVIVVDDGSTDESRMILARYARQVKVVLKPNGGQASALNAGFAVARGDVVIFLDADDYIFPDTAAQVARVFTVDHRVVRIQYPLQIVNREGVATGGLIPPRGRPLLTGDLRAQVLAFADDIAWQPTSGNAFAAWALRKIMPIPEDPYRICADYYLSNLVPLCGLVAALDQPGGAYRIHGGNNHFQEALRLDHLRAIILRTRQIQSDLLRFAVHLGHRGLTPPGARLRSVSFLANRLISLRLDPARHPINGDTVWNLCLKGAGAALKRFDRPWIQRGGLVAWFVAMSLSPEPLARWLAYVYLFRDMRRAFRYVPPFDRSVLSRQPNVTRRVRVT